MPILRLVRGRPGSGKSTYAKRFGCLHLEADMFHVRDGVYDWQSDRARAGHRWCVLTAESCLSHGMDVTVSNTFITKDELAPYLFLEQLYDIEIKIYTCTGEYGNIHDVPAETLQSMKDRWEPIEGEIFV